MSRPPLSNEASWSGFRQAGPRRAIHIAQHVHGPQERGCGRHPLEGKGCKKGRRPAPHAGIVLAQQLVGIELLRTRQGRRFGDAGAEAIPTLDRMSRRDVALWTRCVGPRGDGASCVMTSAPLIFPLLNSSKGVRGASGGPVSLSRSRGLQPQNHQKHASARLSPDFDPLLVAA